MKIGILGGSFDPVHNGHLLVAQDIKEKLELDRILFMPAPRPPHKRCRAPFSVRREMLKRAIHGHPSFALSDIENLRPGTSYTVDTLARLKRRCPKDKLFLIIGADQFQELATWKEPKRLRRFASLIVMTRPGSRTGKGILPARRIPVRQIGISSSEIRERVACGLSIRDMVPESVWRMISRKRLYELPGRRP